MALLNISSALYNAPKSMNYTTLKLVTFNSLEVWPLTTARRCMTHRYGFECERFSRLFVAQTNTE